MPGGCHKDHAEPILREIRGRHEVDGVEMGVGLLVEGGRLVGGVPEGTQTKAEAERDKRWGKGKLCHFGRWMEVRPTGRRDGTQQAKGSAETRRRTAKQKDSGARQTPQRDTKEGAKAASSNSLRWEEPCSPASAAMSGGEGEGEGEGQRKRRNAKMASPLFPCSPHSQPADSPPAHDMPYVLLRPE
ncbi:hypothetical protein BGZ61DRAFT_481289 [Ilyonectria robusta]|uniref:uncharacterized protein n=1 Tax=Ilyonectria robusta TaxID=1079257 RepID=UPI001E8DD49F|nr:uncharacterized protein BGZ61DRAFT_481289 [Ilyonectria robusta]KAH8679228.1 hypothetical protein BGZ61DRAFT_481289 [Ilyonectria robusta]